MRACHGEDGKGGVAPSAGWSAGRRSPPASTRSRRSQLSRPTRPRCSTTSAAPCPTTRRARSADDEVYALTAYILAANKLIGENDVMDAKTLPKVKMPNRDNFIMPYPDRL